MLLRHVVNSTRITLRQTMSTAATVPGGTHAFGATPHAEYLDLKFPLPEKRYVGCLACQRRSTVRTMSHATVLTG